MNATPPQVPLCVDLDGTLLRTDSLDECLLLLVRRRPLLIFVLPFWLLFGRAYFKRQIAKRVTLDAAQLPYDDHVLQFVKNEKERGRTVLLVTGSDQLWVEPIARYLGFFDEVVASDGVRNVSGNGKRRVLCERFGAGGFDYIGNHRVDIPVWRHARKKLVAGASASLSRRVLRLWPDAEVLSQRVLTAATVYRALRIHQWVKNFLVAIPLVAAHRLFDLPSVSGVIAAFLAFGLCASGLYLVNDMLDLCADRQHRSKRFRPLASGELPIKTAVLSSAILLVLASVIARELHGPFLLVFVMYAVTSLLYSLYLKRVIVVDIIALASLYAIRILAGGYAADIVVSPWLLTFSLFFFLSLACLKRFAELRELPAGSLTQVHGRGYMAIDLNQIAYLGSAGGYLSILVFAMYMQSSDVTQLYRLPEALWLITPLMVYWISRIWILAQRGQVAEDPVVFAISDKVSYLVGILFIIVLLVAI